ncbi:MAG: hypothetical protein WCF24_00680 [Acidimicrobiales bacterium]
MKFKTSFILQTSNELVHGIARHASRVADSHRQKVTVRYERVDLRASDA